MRYKLGRENLDLKVDVLQTAVKNKDSPSRLHKPERILLFYNPSDPYQELIDLLERTGIRYLTSGSQGGPTIAEFDLFPVYGVNRIRNVLLQYLPQTDTI